VGLDFADARRVAFAIEGFLSLVVVVHLEISVNMGICLVQMSNFRGTDQVESTFGRAAVVSMDSANAVVVEIACVASDMTDMNVSAVVVYCMDCMSRSYIDILDLANVV
jgi:hypothetical protein